LSCSEEISIFSGCEKVIPATRPMRKAVRRAVAFIEANLPLVLIDPGQFRAILVEKVGLWVR